MTASPGRGAAVQRQRQIWTFNARFRRHAFGWRSQPAIARIKEAVSEITRVARHDRALAAEGAVLLLEPLSPALEHVDSSSGAIGAAVNRAIETLVEIIAPAPAGEDSRSRAGPPVGGVSGRDANACSERLDRR
jgi:hypothetical protein